MVIKDFCIDLFCFLDFTQCWILAKKLHAVYVVFQPCGEFCKSDWNETNGKCPIIDLGLSKYGNPNPKKQTLNGYMA